MRNKVLLFLLMMMMSINLLGCSDVKTQEKEGTSLQITQLRYEKDYFKKAFLYQSLLKVYEERTGIMVDIRYIDCKDEQEAMRIISTKGQTGELGDLIYLEMNEYGDEFKANKLVHKLTDVGAAIDVRGKVDNYEDLLSIYGKTNYVPAGMLCKLTPIHKDIVDEYKITKEIFVDNKVMLNSMKKIISDKQIALGREFLKKEIKSRETDYYEILNDEVVFLEDKFERYLEDIVESLKGREYKTNIFEEDYDYIMRNYIGYGRDSKKIDKKSELDFKHQDKIDIPFRKQSIMGIMKKNKWVMRQVARGYEEIEGVVEPKVYKIQEIDFKLNTQENISSSGFLVLKNSHKKDIATDFLNFMLSEDIQANIAASINLDPVIKVSEEFLNMVVGKINEQKTDPNDRIELSEEMKILIMDIYEKMGKKEFEEKLIDINGARTYTIKTMIKEEFEEIVLRSLFDKDYKESEREKDIKAAIRKVNLKIKEIL